MSKDRDVHPLTPDIMEGTMCLQMKTVAHLPDGQRLRRKPAWISGSWCVRVGGNQKTVVEAIRNPSGAITAFRVS